MGEYLIKLTSGHCPQVSFLLSVALSLPIYSLPVPPFIFPISLPVSFHLYFTPSFHHRRRRARLLIQQTLVTVSGLPPRKTKFRFPFVFLGRQTINGIDDCCITKHAHLWWSFSLVYFTYIYSIYIYILKRQHIYRFKRKMKKRSSGDFHQSVYRLLIVRMEVCH